ncbi:MAG: hypothetical protein AAF492_28445, partial [Verrucomicrobiota bacterium]
MKRILLVYSLMVSGIAVADEEAAFDPDKIERLSVQGVTAFRHAGTVTHVDLLPDGKRLLTAARDGTARIWDLETGDELKRFYHPEGADIWAAHALPGGKKLVTAGAGEMVTLWNIDKAVTNRTFEHGTTVFRVAHLEQTNRLIASDASNLCIEWDLSDGGQIRKFAGHSDDVYTVLLSAGGDFLFTGSKDGSFR